MEYNKRENKYSHMCNVWEQESANTNEAEQQFQELATQINLLQKTHRIILLGDLNAKVEINRQHCKQKESRNGKMLTDLVKNTKTLIVNTLGKHQGTWTRVNRKNTNEKSIIDYIIISQTLQHKVIESKTDNNHEYLITGINPTDHNVLTATIDTTLQTNKNKTKKWMTGTKEEWRDFNKLLQEEWVKTTKKNRTQQHYSKL